MRREFQLPAIALLVALTGCAPEIIPTDGGLVDAVTTAGTDTGASSSLPVSPASTPLGGAGSTTVTGSVSGSGNYQLFDLGSAWAGEEWTVSMQSLTGAPRSFTVVLMDADRDLIMRKVVSSSRPLSHVTRLDTSEVYLGVMPSYGSSGGSFRFDVELAAGATVPSPQQQVVYVNFGGGSGVRIHGRDGEYFSPFDAAMVGDVYAGQTEEMKQTILEAMRDDYAGFNVMVLSSDDGPPPAAGTYTTVHFGGEDNNLLGLADSVDMYNEDRSENCIVYVDSFEQYSVMRLTLEENGVYARQCGQPRAGDTCWGLYHTKDPGRDHGLDGLGLGSDRGPGVQARPARRQRVPDGNGKHAAAVGTVGRALYRVEGRLGKDAQ